MFHTGKQGDDTTSGTAKVFEVLPDDARDKDYDVEVRATSSSAPKAKELMRRQGARALQDKLATFIAALSTKDGDERALAADKARREEEARKAAEAEITGAAGYAAASADVRLPVPSFDYVVCLCGCLCCWGLCLCLCLYSTVTVVLRVRDVCASALCNNQHGVCVWRFLRRWRQKSASAKKRSRRRPLPLCVSHLASSLVRCDTTRSHWCVMFPPLALSA